MNSNESKFTFGLTLDLYFDTREFEKTKKLCLKLGHFAGIKLSFYEISFRGRNKVGISVGIDIAQRQQQTSHINSTAALKRGNLKRGILKRVLLSDKLSKTFRIFRLF